MNGSLNRKISYLTFECSAKCNMDCRFCFSDWREKSHVINTGEAKSAIKQLTALGLEAINFTGGEPLMRHDVVELLQYAKSLGLKVIVSTNGILLKQYLPSISRYIDYIGLPLDSSEPIIPNSIRQTKAAINHHSLILELIDIIKNNYPHIGIKINTLVAKPNLKSIDHIGKLIDGKVVSWKLSQFVPASYGLKHTKDFAITDKEYLDAVRKCRDLNPGINIIATVAYSRDKGCRVLSSNGHLLKPSRNKFIDLGVVSADPELLDDYDNDMNIKFFEMTYMKGRNNEQ